MRVLVLTQVVDRQDGLLGFTHQWIAQLAQRCEHVVVLALSVGDHDLPPNVTVESLGKDRGRGRLGVLAGFYRGLRWHVGAVDGVFVHMVPRYAWLAALLMPLRRVPITLWYTHRSVDLDLRLAIPVVKHIATAHPTSFPLLNAKVRAIGHGIDTTLFSPAESTPADPPTIISLGRLSPIKRHEMLIRAAAILQDMHARTDLRFVIAGAVPAGDDGSYRDFLESEIKRLFLRDRVTILDAVPAHDVPDLLRQMTAAVNLSPPGLFDKAALEAMLCGVPTLVANDAFDDLLGDQADELRIPSGEDAGALAAKLAALLDHSPEERRAMALDVASRVAAAHSLDGLMDRLVDLMRS